MRTIVLALSTAGIVFSWGCKPPPKADVEERFKSEVRRYFYNLNSENELRRQQLRMEQTRFEESPVYPPPTGVVYQSYIFDPESFVVLNFKCRTCGVRLMVLTPILDYLCPACRHSPYVEHPKDADLLKSPCTLCVGTDQRQMAPKESLISREAFEASKAQGAEVRNMFELTQEDTSKPLEAVVRYIRRSWSWDRWGVVRVSQKAKEGVAEGWIPVDEGEGSARPGYHRLDATFLGEIKFRLQGENLVRLEGPTEEPMRLWKDLKTMK